MEPDLQKHTLLRRRRQIKVSVKPFQRLVGFGVKPQERNNFYSMLTGSFSHPILKGWGCKMSEQEQAYWRKFLETGQVTDYLRYRKYTAEQEQNPLRRIEETSRHKKFY